MIEHMECGTRHQLFTNERALAGPHVTRMRGRARDVRTARARSGQTAVTLTCADAHLVGMSLQPVLLSEPKGEEACHVGGALISPSLSRSIAVEPRLLSEVARVLAP